MKIKHKGLLISSNWYEINPGAPSFIVRIQGANGIGIFHYRFFNSLRIIIKQYEAHK